MVFFMLEKYNSIELKSTKQCAAPFIVAHAQNTKAFKKVSNLFIFYYFDIIIEIRNLITCDQSLGVLEMRWLKHSLKWSLMIDWINL